MVGLDHAARTRQPDGVIVAALAASFLIFALSSPLVVGIIGATLVVILTAYRPAAAVALAPLTFPFTLYPRAFGDQKIAPSEAAVLLLCAGLILHVGGLFVLNRGDLREVVRTCRPPGWAAATALALLVIASLSLLTVADPAYLKESLREYRTVIVVPLIYGLLAWLALRTEEDLRRALLALGLAAAGISLVAAGRTALGLGGIVAEGVRRATWPYEHANNLALFVGRGGAACVGLALGWPTAAGRRLALGLAALCAAGILLTFSRGGWFALLGCSIILALLAGRRRLGLTTAALAILLVLGLPRLGIDRLAFTPNGDPGSVALRLDIWRSTAAMIADRPLTGVGLDQFLYQYERRYVAPAAWGERYTSHPHNLFLDFWARLGILGLAWSIGAWALALGVAVAAYRRSAGGRPALILGATGVLLYSLFHGLVDNGFFLPDIALCFWLAMAVLARAARPEIVRPAR